MGMIPAWKAALIELGRPDDDEPWYQADDETWNERQRRSRALCQEATALRVTKAIRGHVVAAAVELGLRCLDEFRAVSSGRLFRMRNVGIKTVETVRLYWPYVDVEPPVGMLH